MSEKSVKKMASYLRNGASMLDKYCPKCDSILFRLKSGEIFCPKCNQEVKIVKTDEELASILSENRKIEQEFNNSSENKTIRNHSVKNFGEINNQISRLINKLLTMLENTSDMLLIEKILINIEKSLAIMSKLQEIQKAN